MNQRIIRDLLRLAGALLFSWLYIPHYLVFLVIGGACPKNAPSGASTPSRVAQKADRALNCGLFGQPGGGVKES